MKFDLLILEVILFNFRENINLPRTYAPFLDKISHFIWNLLVFMFDCVLCVYYFNI